MFFTYTSYMSWPHPRYHPVVFNGDVHLGSGPLDTQHCAGLTANLFPTQDEQLIICLCLFLNKRSVDQKPGVICYAMVDATVDARMQRYIKVEKA